MHNTQFDTALIATVQEITTDIIFWQRDTKEIEHDVDLAFSTIANCFPQIAGIDDTVTRRCAKDEIYMLVKFYKGDVKDFSQVCEYVEKYVTCEEVFADVYATE